MENNNWNWYENATPNSGNGNFNNVPPTGGNENNGGKKDRKRNVTWTQLIVCMLVMALIGGGIGAGAVYFANPNSESQQVLNNSGNTVVTTPTPEADPSSSQGTTGTDSSATSTTPPSSGINVSSGTGQTSTDDTGAIIRTCMSAVVGIDIEQEVSNNYAMFGYGQTESGETSETVGSGSGVIVTSDGYIVTNNHVVEGADTIKVHLEDGTEYTATLIGTDSYTDLAIIKIDATGLPAATLGNSSEMLVCDAVYAIGNPLGVFASSVSEGIISGLDRVIEIDGNQMTLMQTTAAVNPGNSGGGLFNSKGELIGIVNAKSSGTDVEGLGFAIPIDSAKQIITDLIDLGYVTGRPYLGITMQNISIRTNSSNGNNGGFFPFGSYGIYGYVNRVQVMGVEEGSAAQAAGMQVNDIIVSLNGTEINGSSDLSSLLYEYNVGDTVTITVQRGSELVDLSVTLGERKNA